MTMRLALSFHINSTYPDQKHAFPFSRSPRQPPLTRSLLYKKYRCYNTRSCIDGSLAKSVAQCEKKIEQLENRRCSPSLESIFLTGDVISDSNEWRAVPDIWKYSAEKYGDRVALVDPYHDPPSKLTYKQLENDILDFAEGLRVVGVKPAEKVAVFAENSCRWLVADQGIMATGAVNVVRGSRSPVEELLQIYEHSDSIALAIDNPEFFNRIAKTFRLHATMRFVVLLWGDKSSLANEVQELLLPIYTYNEIVEFGHKSRLHLLDSSDARQKYNYEAISSDDVAMLMYTSGTSGNPKGVMVTHKNLLHQIRNLWDAVPAVPRDIYLTMLPPWHAYGRACEYFGLTHGIELVYTNVKYLKDDLKLHQPAFVVSVPLVFETLYKGIHKEISTSSTFRKLVSQLFINISLAYMEAKRIYEGKYLPRNQKQVSYLVSMLDWLLARAIAFVLEPLHMLANKLVYSKIRLAVGITKAGISGGGSLPAHVDKFYEAIGVKLQNGYGLTETSPVVAVRLPTHNVLGSVGGPLPHTEIKVVDSETGEILPAGSKGVIKVTGPQVMKGYYKNEAATKRVLDEDGWLDTGDIGWIAPNHSVGRSRHCGGMVVLEGRAKDTIVLSNGENVEPSEIEEAALRSSLIYQIIVIGQDQRRLGAIIVPNKEEFATMKLNINGDAREISKEEMAGILHKELTKWTSGCSFQIGPILLIDEPFTIDNGLMTPTMKIRRDKVEQLYKEKIQNLYK